MRPMVSHSEGRLMKANMMGHEAARHFGSVLDTFVPPPRGDWGWALRHCHDLGVRVNSKSMRRRGGILMAGSIMRRESLKTAAPLRSLVRVFEEYQLEHAKIIENHGTIEAYVHDRFLAKILEDPELKHVKDL